MNGIILSSLLALTVAVAAIALCLCRIARALESGALTGPPGAAGLRGIPGIPGPQGKDGHPGKDALLPPHLMLQTAPASTSSAMARVMRQEGGTWVACEWVRENTPAWQKAWDTPGVALLPQAGELQLGNQSA